MHVNMYSDGRRVLVSNLLWHSLRDAFRFCCDNYFDQDEGEMDLRGTASERHGVITGKLFVGTFRIHTIQESGFLLARAYLR